MMRWLKDKKKEKRSNSNSQNDAEKEDDYGFGKEKSAAKSPSSRRQLPPTPATPEEMSPHIYEEIPDLPLCCMPDNEKVLLQNKFGKSKHGNTAGTASEAASASMKPGASQRDDINPYMIVSVDKEVRQTPTEFHRNGTPEVHCDVIVKETHCEILLSRKPKIGTFRLDNAVLSVGGENASERRNIRSNTHLSSHDKRVAADVYIGGSQSAAFSVTSSAFSSSSSASKIQSSGASSMTLVNVFEKQHPLETSDEASSSNTGENGVITYSSASNFIPRSTKLVFNPLPGENPCKEAFGSDSSDELRTVGYPSVKEVKQCVNSVSFLSAREQHMGSQCVTYASIHSDNDPSLSIDGHVTYASVQDLHYSDEKKKPDCNFDDLLRKHHSNFPLNSLADNTDVGGINKTGIIQSLSPSTSSNCIYALVTFPAEPNHYNTISDIISPGFQENLCHGENGSSANEPFCCETGHSTTNAEINDMHVSNEFSSISFHVNSTHNLGSQASHFNFSKRICGDLNLNQFHPKPGNTKSTDNAAVQVKVGNEESIIRAKVHDRVPKQNMAFPELSTHAEHRLELEFCLCSDDHSSSCGCHDAKHSHDDDVTSVAGATHEGSGSCRSCGRLIRQITYSESYSDETSEHVYASRLLVRTGRRFSSPDITFLEVSNSEFQDIQNPRSLDCPYAVSRDDSWTSTRSSDMIPPTYHAATGCNIIKTDNMPWVTKENSGETLGHYALKRDSVGLLHGHLCCTRDIQKSSSVGSKVTSAGNALDGSSDQWDSAVTSVKNTDFSFDSRICDTLNTDQNRGHAEQIVDLSQKNYIVIIPELGGDSSQKHDIKITPEPVTDSFQKHDIKITLEPVIDSSQKNDLPVIPEPKSSTFTGLLSRFSRTKSSKPAKPEVSEMSNACVPQADRAQDIVVAKCNKSLEEIPEKNTRKLSKFFQRLSSKDIHKAINGCVALSETDNQANSCTPIETGSSNGRSESFKTPCVENCTSGSNSQKCWNDDDFSSLLNKGNDAKEGESQNFNSSSDGCEQKVRLHAQLQINKHHSILSEASAGLSETASAPLKEAARTSNAKSQCKTDSGDTCYEYDISTSSEGEQTGYEHFLLKVRKTLNLEHEVQHIAESSAVRKKRLCKHCKKDGLYSTIDDEEEDKDELCPHLAAKFGDLRAIFEDMVVDQRAAILDCLTDFMHSPYNIRGHSHEGFCRECGCEILTSDSESQTTICSLLSQQLFRMTSPNGQPLSCDSDEGTMADNSCESADDDDNEANGNRKDTNSKKSPYDDNSSGYDEPKDKLGQLSQKLRKKEKKEKRHASSTVIDFGPKENDSENHERMSAFAFTNILEDLSASFNFLSLPAEPSINKQQIPDKGEPKTSTIFSDITWKNNWNKNSSAPQSSHSSRQTLGPYFSHGADSFQGNSDHSGACNISGSRASFVTEKVLQDIYAPLPSKALSLLASKKYGPPSGLSCSCGRVPQASVVTAGTAHLATGKTETPPTGCIKRNGFSQSSSSGLIHCDSDKKSGVAPVQKHLRNRKKTVEGELFNFSEKKDSGDPESDRHTIGLLPENDVLANNGCRLGGKNAESNDCLAPQTKRASRMSTKERSLVPGKNGNTGRNRPLAEGGGNKSDCGLAKSSNEVVKKCSRLLPHTMTRGDTDDFALTDDNLADKHSGLSCTSVVQDMMSGDTKANKKYARRHRLDLEALDLLPESAVDEDLTTANSTHHRRVQPKRSKVIEKMAKIFENSSCADNQTSDKHNQAIMKNVTAGKQSTVRDEVEKKDNVMHSSKHIPHTFIHDQLFSDNGETDTNKFAHVRHSKRRVPDPDLYSLEKQDNLYARSHSSHLNFNESPPVGDIKDRRALKTRRSSSESRRDGDNEIKPTCHRSDNESGPLKTNELKAGRIRAAKGRLSFAYLTESRQATQKSPTPSTSSASSSSSGKKRNGHVKHEVSKKSYSRKRSKHRPERAKNGHGKEERTYYYFSSDFSDIDVAEVNNESGNIYSATHNKALASCGRKQSTSHKKPANTPENAAATASPSAQNKNMEDGRCEQEVYALPNDSVDLRGRKGCVEKSPEIRHTKRTDVYKSRKSNNKLLSDLIIRNYDMQLYDNV